MFRQSDLGFVDVLNKIRVGTLDSEVSNFLQSRIVNSVMRKQIKDCVNIKHDSPVFLSPYKHAVDQYNKKAMSQIVSGTVNISATAYYLTRETGAERPTKTLIAFEDLKRLSDRRRTELPDREKKIRKKKITVTANEGDTKTGSNEDTLSSSASSSVSPADHEIADFQSQLEESSSIEEEDEKKAAADVPAESEAGSTETKETTETIETTTDTVPISTTTSTSQQPLSKTAQKAQARILAAEKRKAARKSSLEILIKEALDSMQSPPMLTLKKGAHVLLVKNLDRTHVNGSQGVIFSYFIFA